MVRDGVPIIDYLGPCVSEPEALQALAAGCQPLNVFGNVYAIRRPLPGYDGLRRSYDPAQLQQAAIDYAFVETCSSRLERSGHLQFQHLRHLWEGIGAGPLTGAFGLEV